MIAARALESSSLLRRDELNATQRKEMCALLEGYFEGVTPSQFDRDLDEKNWVVQLRLDGRLVGFSTILAVEETFEGEPLTVIYSGDTIVAPEAWRTPALSRAWIAAVNRLRAEHPDRKCYWLLLTSGFRTYRFLPVFWRQFYPRWNAVTPAFHAALMRQLAAQRYGSNYDQSAGVVRFARPQRLRGKLAQIADNRRTDPDVAFFLRQNPGHEDGDELVCLTEIAEANLTPAGKRMVDAGAP